MAVHLLCHGLTSGGKLLPYIAPMRKISFDGYVNYENHLYCVPLAYSGKTVRVRRTAEILEILSADGDEVLYTHQVSWTGKPVNCVGQ